MVSEHLMETDVLVIGGGLAGFFAAIKAKEQGVDVVLVDKAYAGKSGSSPYAFWFSVFNPEWGHDLSAWMDHVNSIGEHLNNREWTEIVFRESYGVFQDLRSWGVEFIKNSQGELRRYNFEGMANESVQLQKRVFGETLRKQALKRGVKIVDRVMLTDLIKSGDAITGAIGFAMETGDLYVIKAKSVALCSGCSSFKPDGWPVSELTGDGEAMAFRAGAAVAGKEFGEIKSSDGRFPAAIYTLNMWKKDEPTVSDAPAWAPPQCKPFKGFNAEGKEVLGQMGSNFIELEMEVHAGRAPIMTPTYGGQKAPRMGGAAAGISIHTTGGVWPSSSRCDTNLPGLFVGGDSCSTMQVGAVYPGVGDASCGACVSGSHAGTSAAEYAKACKKFGADEEEIARLKKALYAPLERKGGFTPRWVTQTLRNTMIPYNISYIKRGDRMQAALTLVESMRDDLVPKLYARDIHDLRLAIETKNMVFNAELQLRASLFRTESRGTHYREDYPRRDDPEWLAWVLLKNIDGVIVPSKQAIPEEWRPNLAKPYHERYLNRFPGE
jgi:succinate dehydrogenase/fumarate reductase flavoprotein subunit